MEKPTIKIFDSETGEEIERPMNKAELDEFKAKKAEIEEIKLQATAKQAARQSALEKLAALGLTEAEIQALAG